MLLWIVFELWFLNKKNRSKNTIQFILVICFFNVKVNVYPKKIGHLYFKDILGLLICIFEHIFWEYNKGHFYNKSICKRYLGFLDINRKCAKLHLKSKHNKNHLYNEVCIFEDQQTGKKISRQSCHHFEAAAASQLFPCIFSNYLMLHFTALLAEAR
jgi:hypothetical protein